jgi:hypothetical protein
MSRKFVVFLFLPILLISACSAPAAPTTPAAPTQENPATAVGEPTSSATRATSIPKHKDLIFVEFFAVT